MDPKTCTALSDVILSFIITYFISRFFLFAALENKPTFSVDDEMLQHHLDFLYTELEPRVIADQMFQASVFTVADHDYITDNPKRRKRLRNLLEILKKKRMHDSFLVVLKDMEHYVALKTLETNSQFRHDPCKLLFILTKIYDITGNQYWALQNYTI